MKLLFTLILLCLLTACQENSKTPLKKDSSSINDTTQSKDFNHYPEVFSKVLTAHGGIDLWNKQETLKFTIGTSDETEQYIVDLNTRKDKIITYSYEMGYDGKNAWILDKKGEYKGKAEFMHNLMFYFYAMPFVLADPGVNYEQIEDMEFEGKSYHGLKLTFTAGIGASSNDEYYLYYNPETYKMGWLAYKASFGTSKMPEKPNYIKYDQWEEVSGLLLPTSIAWYGVDEQGVIKKEKNRVNFYDISLSEEANPLGFYSIPDNAHKVEIP